MASLSNTAGAARYEAVAAMAGVDADIERLAEYGDVWLRGHVPRFGDSAGKVVWYISIELRSKRAGFSAEYRSGDQLTPADAVRKAVADLTETLK